MNTIKEDSSYFSTISLDINSTGPHYEDINEFEDSFFRSVYKRAFMQLDNIIYNFKKNSKHGISAVDRRYYSSGTNYEGCPNIMTFVGKRGSGKTSAMLSFLEALKHYYSYRKMRNGDLSYGLNEAKNPLFSCLDCIDGSLLEHGEDIFKVVLAQMYQKFIDLDKQDGINKGEDFAYRKRELLKQLEEIYKTVCDIENMENMEKRQSKMAELQSLSSSQKVKKDFEELIYKFTALMKYERLGILEESSEHYVVITIDDIDLNVGNGFSMLEKIHRYCMVQNVIVLLSVDIEQMLSIVSKNFYKVLPKVDKLLCAGEEQVHVLAMDYLNKVMPVNYRLYMPDLGKYHSLHDLAVRKENSGIKRSVFCKLYKRIGVYFDSQGIKQHFYEPKSMRQLTCFYLMLESMECIGVSDIYDGKEMEQKQKGKFVRIWEENYRLLIEDLWYRIVVEKLYIDRDAVKLCEMITKEDVRRARDEVVNFYFIRYKREESGCPVGRCNCMSENKIESIQTYIYDCSYGQLIEAIYELGRKEEGRYKPLVHYLLGYFSYAFTRIYIYEKLRIKSNEEVLVKEGTFKSLIGENIVDDWSRLMMPNSVKNRNMDVEELGAASGDKSNKILEYYSNYKGVILTQILFSTLKESDELEESDWFKYIAELIRNLELTLLFFTNIREDGQNGIIKSDSFSWDFEIAFNREGKEQIMFIPKIEGSPYISFVGDFSILNFVANSMYASKMLEKVEKGLLDCLAERYGLYEDNSKRLKERAVFELKKYSLKSQFEFWEQKYGECPLPLPVYWFDFTYNILKRVKRAMNEEFIVSADTEDMFFCIQKLYKYVGKQLEEQQEFYSLKVENGEQAQEKDEESDSYQLVKRFKECPVVDYFLGVEKNSQEEIDRKEFIHSVMLKLRRFSQNY